MWLNARLPLSLIHIYHLGFDEIGCAGPANRDSGGNDHGIARFDGLLFPGHLNGLREQPVCGVHLPGEIGVNAPGNGQLAAAPLVLAQSDDGAGGPETGDHLGSIARLGGRQNLSLIHI